MRIFFFVSKPLNSFGKANHRQGKEKLLEYSGGKNLKQITKELINAFDPDEIEKMHR